jgi:hypothetical protein
MEIFITDQHGKPVAGDAHGNHGMAFLKIEISVGKKIYY